MRHYKDSLIFLAVVLLAGFFFLGFQTQADETYDLKANYLMMTSAKCELNQICNFRAEIKNLGKEFALNFPLTFSLSSTNFTADAPVLVSPEINTAVGTNEYMVYSLSGVWSQPGAATLTFSVSVADHFAESDTNNNSVSLAVNVAAHDLAAEAIDILPAYPRVNQTCQIQVKVKNNGSNNLYSEAGLNLTRNFPDFSLANSSNTRPSMSEVVRAGGYLYWDYQGKFTSAGEKQLSFTIDPDDVLKEINLNNNAVTKKIVVYNATDTDLAIDSISFSLTKIILGAPLDITLGVKNAGKTSLTDALGLAKDGLSFSLPYFDYGVNDLTLDAYPTLTTSFNPDGVFHYKFHGAFSQPGNLNLVFTINRDKQLIEADYGNNATSTIVKVYKNQAEADSFSILSKQVDMVSSTTAIINWTTDFNTTGVLNYGLASVNVSENAVADNNNKTAHTFTLNGWVWYKTVPPN